MNKSRRVQQAPKTRVTTRKTGQGEPKTRAKTHCIQKGV